MIILKCKMCGGNIEHTEGKSFGTCDSCGNTMTLPTVNEERVVNLFNRANNYRLQNEFDKALATYETVLAEDSKNSEAHWGCVLSRFGIEYIEDPKTHKRIPTCHRVQTKSILSDMDYKAALEFAPDQASKELYQKEAVQILEIQKGILSIASKAEPYDVFICYKETDANGKRTIDSTLAQDIYYTLEKEGIKAFFSRITLEDKLGSEYEPYIFSALNSAKIMIVVGTTKEYFNAVWVKNEWSRFISLTKSNNKKSLIPCYRNMDAYNLPSELAIYQSQDMNKIGSFQDLLRGIKKLLTNGSETTSCPSLNASNKTVTEYTIRADALSRRAFLCLEESDWEKASELFEESLNLNPENPKTYIGQLMAELKIDTEENITKQNVELSRFQNFQKALRFANEKYRIELLYDQETAHEFLINSAFKEIEYSNWRKANDLFDESLIHDPKNAKVYIGKLLSEFSIYKEADLAEQDIDVFKSPNYQKALEHADEDYRNELLKYQYSAYSIMTDKAFIELYNSRWHEARYILEEVLRHLPQSAKTYVGKLMCELKLRSEDELANQKIDLSTYSSFNNALLYADENYKQLLIQYRDTAKKRSHIDQTENINNNIKKLSNEIADWKRWFWISLITAEISFVCTLIGIAISEGLFDASITVFTLSMLILPFAGFNWYKTKKEYDSKYNTSNDIQKTSKRFK